MLKMFFSSLTGILLFYFFSANANNLSPFEIIMENTENGISKVRRNKIYVPREIVVVDSAGIFIDVSNGNLVPIPSISWDLDGFFFELPYGFGAKAYDRSGPCSDCGEVTDKKGYCHNTKDNCFWAEGGIRSAEPYEENKPSPSGNESED